MSRNAVKISIMDAEYIVRSDDDEAYIRQTAAEVESKIKEVMKDHRTLSAMSASILASLDYCDQAKKSTEDAENLRIKIKECLEDSSSFRMDLDEARRENERLKKEINMLRARFTGDSDVSSDNAPGKAYPIKSSSSRPPVTRETGKLGKTTTVSNDHKDDTKKDKKDPREEIISFFDKKD